jgi:MFS family permease
MKPSFKFDAQIAVLSGLRFVIDCSFSIMAPFFPQILADKGIPIAYNGWIFSIFSFTLIVTSPIIGFFLDRMQRTKVLQVGLILLGLSMIGFGFAILIKDETTYIIVILSLRGIQGITSAINDTVIMSITGLLYPDHQDLVIAIILMTSGVGFTLAPVLGSILYDTIGHQSPFIMFGTIQLLLGIFLRLIITTKVNRKIEDSVMLSRSRKLSMAIDLHSESQSVIPNLPAKDKIKLRRKLKFYHFLIQRRILFPLLAGAFF